MLRDLHGRINTTGFGYGKLLPYQARVPAAASTLFEAILLHHLKLIFYHVGGTPFSFGLYPPRGACPVSSTTLPMTGHGQWGLLVTAVNEGGIPTIVAQEHYTESHASTPEKLRREMRKRERFMGSSIPDSRAPEPDGDIVRCAGPLFRFLP
jgi:hypothetical protein